MAHNLDDLDVGRKALWVRSVAVSWQDGFSAIEEVIAQAWKIFVLIPHLGIDLTDIAGALLSPDTEPGRRAALIKKNVTPLQESFTSVEKVMSQFWPNVGAAMQNYYREIMFCLGLNLS